MSSFEWMELQGLNSEISASRTRLAAARTKKDYRLVRTLEAEITAGERRRIELLAHISSHIASVHEGAPPGDAAENADPGQAPVVSGVQSDQAEDDRQSPEVADIILDGGAAVTDSTPEVASVEGGIVVWDQLTPGDIEHAKNELDVRRAEVLARQVDELKALDADEAQLDSLEQAIDVFLRKFAPPEAGAIVSLGEERESRQQSRA